MTGPLLLVASATAWASGGVMLGAAYFAALRWNAELFAGGTGPLKPAALMLGRFAGATAVLIVASRAGALPLLSLFLGFLVARSVTLSRLRRAG